MRSIARSLTNVDDVTHDHALMRANCTNGVSVFHLRRILACHNDLLRVSSERFAASGRLLRSGLFKLRKIRGDN
jgi:hypothetical protein